MSGLFTEDIMYHYKNCNDELRQDSIEWCIIVCSGGGGGGDGGSG